MSTPLYIKLTQNLINYIQDNLQENDLLPSERQLVEIYGMSRTTVRIALKELERMGYIRSIPGKGWSVVNVYEDAVNLGGMYSFTNQMEALGMTPEAQLLQFTMQPADARIAKQLAIEDGEDVYYLQRLRLADKKPMMLEDTYLPVRKFPALSPELIVQEPLYQIMSNKYHVRIKYAKEAIRGSIADQSLSNILQLDTSVAIFDIHRITYDVNNEIIEYTHSQARADQFVYYAVHTNHQ